MRVLVVNAGSSSLKLSIVESDDSATPVGVDDIGDLDGIDAVGHRIVHGGERFREAVPIDDAVVSALGELAALAPLHQEKSLATLAAVEQALPDVPAVACFDTAFHATLTPAAATYALPERWRERWGIRRYGFHGLSHAYGARRTAQLLGRPEQGLRVVTCHLGAGASVTAVRDGQSVDTTMGFTPLEGLAMATRSGTVDPGLLLWLLERTSTSEAEMAHALEHESGLLALAGTADMREVITAAGAGDDRARLGFDVYVHRLRGAIAAMAAAMGGLDALTFTGGVGEHAPEVRAAAARGLGFLGVALDEDADRGAVPDADVSAPGAAVRTFVVAAREDLEIARQVRAVVLRDSTAPKPR